MIRWIRGWWTWRRNRDIYNFLVDLESGADGFVDTPTPGAGLSWQVDSKHAADDEQWSERVITDEPVEVEILLWQSLDRGDAVFRVTRVP